MKSIRDITSGVAHIGEPVYSGKTITFVSVDECSLFTPELFALEINKKDRDVFKTKIAGITFV